MLVDEVAVLPSVAVRSDVKNTYRQKRAALTEDTADVLKVLGKADLDLVP